MEHKRKEVRVCLLNVQKKNHDYMDYNMKKKGMFNENFMISP
jgi:hypothetical protein